MNVKILNANWLKLIAVIAMTIDHLGWAFGTVHEINTGIVVMRVIGRLTMPIMCFFIAEGYYYTRDWRKYCARLFGFALIAHFAYVFVFNYQDLWSFLPFAHGKWQSQTSVLWGLAWGLVLIRIQDSQWKWPWKMLATVVILVLTLPADWLCVTPLLIWAFWKNRGHLLRQMVWLITIVGVFVVIMVTLFHSVLDIINLMVVLCLPILWQYNGQRGKSPRVNIFWKWFFYCYYPLHLLVIGVLLHGGVLV